MPVPTARLPVAVVGAGPVGLAAAAHLLERGLVPLVLEAGDQPGANIARWRHVRLFTPWCLALDPAALRLLATTGWTPPDPDALPTGAELLDGYLRPPWPPPPRSPPTCGSAAPWSGSPARTSAWSAPHRAATACRSSCACAPTTAASATSRPARSSTRPAPGPNPTRSAPTDCPPTASASSPTRTAATTSPGRRATDAPPRSCSPPATSRSARSPPRSPATGPSQPSRPGRRRPGPAASPTSCSTAPAPGPRFRAGSPLGHEAQVSIVGPPDLVRSLRCALHHGLNGLAIVHRDRWSTAIVIATGGGRPGFASKGGPDVGENRGCDAAALFAIRRRRRRRAGAAIGANPGRGGRDGRQAGEIPRAGAAAGLRDRGGDPERRQPVLVHADSDRAAVAPAVAAHAVVGLRRRLRPGRPGRLVRHGGRRPDRHAGPGQLHK